MSSRQQIVAAGGNWQTQVQGTGAAFAQIRSWDTELGSFFTQEDVDRAGRVVVLGSVVRDQIFGAGADPIGDTVRVNNQPFTVIGVLSRKGQSAMGQDQDDTVVAPYTTVQKRLLGITHLTSIMVAAEPGTTTAAVSAGVAEILRRRHKLAGDDADDFAIRSPEEMARVLSSTTDTMSYLLASVAAISLLVGGIGIMNIMLVSVTERTREIGLRRALGARRTDVLRQFVAEALSLSLAGGLAGVCPGRRDLVWLERGAEVGDRDLEPLGPDVVRLRRVGGGGLRVRAGAARRGAPADRGAALRVGPAAGCRAVSGHHGAPGTVGSHANPNPRTPRHVPDGHAAILNRQRPARERPLVVVEGDAQGARQVAGAPAEVGSVTGGLPCPPRRAITAPAHQAAGPRPVRARESAPPTGMPSASVTAFTMSCRP